VLPESEPTILGVLEQNFFTHITEFSSSKFSGAFFHFRIVKLGSFELAAKPCKVKKRGPKKAN